MTSSQTLEQFLAGEMPQAEVDAPRAGIGAAREFLAAQEARLRPQLGPTAKSPARRRCDALLKKSIQAFKQEDMRAAGLHALEATRADPSSGQAFHMLALALERLGFLARALLMYERALKLDPSDADLYLNLGLAAWKLKMYDGAARLFRLHNELRPDSHQGYNNLAAVLRDQGRFDAAIELLQAVILKLPEEPALWNTVGTVLGERGDFETALTFYNEALRLQPAYGRAFHNMALALSHLGDLDAAIANFDRALPLADNENDRIEIRHAAGLCRAGIGDLKTAWPLYEWRHSPYFKTSVVFGIKAPRWAGEDVAGRRMLLVGEQGLGDEIMFTGLIPDVMDRLGPEGRLLIASDRRLTPLLARSFKGSVCGNHGGFRSNGKPVRTVPWAAGALAPDLYAPMGTPLQWLRPDVASFRPTGPLLIADPQQTAHWRAHLAASGEGPYLGLCWRSMLQTADRLKYYSSLDLWAEALRGFKGTLVNLQYGDCREELAYARGTLKLEIIDVPGLDLKMDLDGAAALSAACDRVLSAPTAAAALAAAVGTETWFVVAGRVWPMLGTDHYPWYPRTRVFWPARFGDWPDVMRQVRAALDASPVARAA